MVIQSASVPGSYYYQNISHSHYIGASSPFSSHLFHRTDKFLLKKGKNGCLETWCFSSDPALWLTLEIVYLYVCMCVCACKNHIIYNTIFTESLAATNKR